MSSPKGIDLSKLMGRGRAYARAIVAEGRKNVVPEDADRRIFEDETDLFFAFMADQGAEFGFRTAKEIARFVYFCRLLQPQESTFSEEAQLREPMDFQVAQRMLPKLNGARRKLEPLLCGLVALCYEPRQTTIEATTTQSPQGPHRTRGELLDSARHAATVGSQDNPLLARGDDGRYLVLDESALYPVAFEKLRRMLQRLNENGFTSFAEA